VAISKHRITSLVALLIFFSSNPAFSLAINLKSCDKELLGLFASKIRSWRRPEPYKGKGILYKNEQIIRKVGKSGKSGKSGKTGKK
jgi:hypothetical protein